VRGHLQSSGQEFDVRGALGFLHGEEDALRRKLFWFAAVRILVIVLLLAGGSYFLLQSRGNAGERAVFWLSALVGAASFHQLCIALFLRAGWRLGPLAVVQVAGDLIFAITLLLLTGVSDSLFSFVLPLVAVSGGSLLGVRGSWWSATATFAAYAAMIWLVQLGFLPSAGLGPGALSAKQAWQALFAHGSAIFLTAGLMAYVLGQAKRAGRRAEEAESSLLHLGVLHDAIVRSIGSGILTTDHRGAISYLNPAGEELLQRTSAELQGEPLEVIFPSVVVDLDDSETFRQETTWVRPGGQRRLLGFALNPLLGPGGTPIGTAAVFQDLTEVRALEARAARSERLATIGELAAGLAHELRNPLASISGAIEMLAKEERGRGQPLFRIVMRETERLDRLVSDFLAYAMPGAPVLEPVDLRELVASTLRVFEHDPGAEALVLRPSLEPAWVFADEDQLRQVLWNLLRNAAQASEPGGVVEVACGPAPTPAAGPASARPDMDRASGLGGASGGRVVLSVRDHGCGIASEELNRIFDPFFTTKARGSGLGLPMVHRVVESLEGELAVDSSEGEGTCFALTFPAAAGGKREEVAGRRG
jgi:two-component system sensor histidine kinase PilS (NtrC family)